MTATDQSPRFERDMPKTLAAIAGSLLVNFAVLYLIGWFLLWQSIARAAIRPETPNEVVVTLEELTPEVISPGEEAKSEPTPYVDTFANQESQVAPDDPKFESDKNTLAATESLPTEPSDMEVPTQDGKEAPIPVVALQDHKFADGPDGEIPNSAAAPAGMPVQPAEELKIPREEAKKPENVAETKPTPSAPEESEVTDPEQTEMRENPAESEAEDAPKTNLEIAEEDGGAAETLEMAKIDVPKTKTAFSDDLQVLDENLPAAEDVEDAMPEKNPEVADPANPMLQAPAPKPNAPLVPKPIAQPIVAVPIQPGMQPSTQTNGDADAAAFSPERVKNKMSGSLSNVGRNAAVDAEKTPLGQYKKQVGLAVERRWHALRQQNAAFVSFGSLKISFLVDRNGNVAPKQINLLHRDANSVVTDFSIRAIAEAEIPPMPAEIITLLGNQPLEVTYDIIIY